MMMSRDVILGDGWYFHSPVYGMGERKKCSSECPEGLKSRGLFVSFASRWFGHFFRKVNVLRFGGLNQMWCWEFHVSKWNVSKSFEFGWKRLKFGGHNIFHILAARFWLRFWGYDFYWEWKCLCWQKFQLSIFWKRLIGEGNGWNFHRSAFCGGALFCENLM